MDKRKLITDLQSKGLKLLDRDTGRKGGAGSLRSSGGDDRRDNGDDTYSHKYCC